MRKKNVKKFFVGMGKKVANKLRTLDLLPLVGLWWLIVIGGAVEKALQQKKEKLGGREK